MTRANESGTQQIKIQMKIEFNPKLATPISAHLGIYLAVQLKVRSLNFLHVFLGEFANERQKKECQILNEPWLHKP